MGVDVFGERSCCCCCGVAGNPPGPRRGVLFMAPGGSGAGCCVLAWDGRDSRKSKEQRDATCGCGAAGLAQTLFCCQTKLRRVDARGHALVATGQLGADWLQPRRHSSSTVDFTAPRSTTPFTVSTIVFAPPTRLAPNSPLPIVVTPTIDPFRVRAHTFLQPAHHALPVPFHSTAQHSSSNLNQSKLHLLRNLQRLSSTCLERHGCEEIHPKGQVACRQCFQWSFSFPAH